MVSSGDSKSYFDRQETWKPFGSYMLMHWHFHNACKFCHGIFDIVEMRDMRDIDHLILKLWERPARKTIICAKCFLLHFWGCLFKTTIAWMHRTKAWIYIHLKQTVVSLPEPFMVFMFSDMDLLSVKIINLPLVYKNVF